jgi:hypothetical protein
VTFSWRQLALPAAVASAAATLVGWLGLLTPAFTDYEREAEPALDALRDGHVGRFLELAPGYGGSLLERAPFALLPSLWGGGGDAVFRSMAAPCLAAGVALALALFVQARKTGPRAGAWTVLVLTAANPITLRALFVGHPEELLVGAMLVGSALVAARGRAAGAGVLLGLAVAGKPWAALGAVPVLALFPGLRAAVRAAVAAGVTAGLVLLPFLLAGAGAVHVAAAAASTSGVIFMPCQAFWFFGEHGDVTGLFGRAAGFRIGPAWAADLSHPLLLVTCLALATAGASALRRRRAPWPDTLLLLAAVLLARCVLDTWNVMYYALPFILALLAWEASVTGLPVLGATATLLTWVSFGPLSDHVSRDVQTAVYLGWAVPLALALFWRAVSGRWSPIQTARPIARTRPVPSSTALAP